MKIIIQLCLAIIELGSDVYSKFTKSKKKVNFLISPEKGQRYLGPHIFVLRVTTWPFPCLLPLARLVEKKRRTMVRNKRWCVILDE